MGRAEGVQAALLVYYSVASLAWDCSVMSVVESCGGTGVEVADSVDGAAVCSVWGSSAALEAAAVWGCLADVRSVYVYFPCVACCFLTFDSAEDVKDLGLFVEECSVCAEEVLVEWGRWNCCLMR